MTLRQWLKKNKISKVDFAVMLGVGTCSVFRYCREGYAGIPENRKKQISIITKGEVQL